MIFNYHWGESYTFARLTQLVRVSVLYAESQRFKPVIEHQKASMDEWFKSSDLRIFLYLRHLIA